MCQSISQAHRTRGIRLAAIADLSPERAVAALKKTGFSSEKYDITGRMSLEDGLRSGKTVITTDSAAMIAHHGIDVVLEVTGNPAAGIRHALLVSPHNLNHNCQGQSFISGSVVSTRSTL